MADEHVDGAIAGLDASRRRSSAARSCPSRPSASSSPVGGTWNLFLLGQFRDTEIMSGDRSPGLVSYARELERRDADVAARIDVGRRAARRVDAIRARAPSGARRARGAPGRDRASPSRASVTRWRARPTRERSSPRQSGASRRSTAPAGRATRRRPKRRGRRGGQRWRRRMRRTRSPGCGSASRRSQPTRLRSRPRPRGSPSRRSTSPARLRRCRGSPTPGAPRPGTSLAEIDEWGARAHAALFVVRGGLESEREKVVVEAHALAEAALGEQTAGVSVALVRRRLEESLARRLTDLGSAITGSSGRPAAGRASRRSDSRPAGGSRAAATLSSERSRSRWDRIRARAVAASRPSRRPSATPSCSA